MKKRFTSILCILAMLIGIIQPVGTFASGFGASISFVSVVCDQNKIYFDVGVDSEEDVRLAVALYDDDGDLIEMRSKDTRFGYGVSLGFTQDANSYKVMLLDNNNNLKPLCSAEDGLTIDVPEYTDNYESNASFVSGLGIISAKHSEFDKDRTMTRAEFAAIVCRMLDVADVAGAFTQDNTYTDVASNHWAAGFINLLGQSGIIDTIEDGKFNPDDAVSYAHAVSALVRCLGYEPVAEMLGGYESIASDLKITLGVNTEDLRAKDIVNMVSNALKAPMLDAYCFNPESADDYFVSDGNNNRQYRTTLTDIGVYVATGVINDLFDGEMVVCITEDSFDYEFRKGREYGFLTDNNAYLDYLYEIADVYVKKINQRDYEVVAVMPNRNSKTLTILSDDVVSYNDEVIKYTSSYDGQTKVADIEAYSNIMLNGMRSDMEEITDDRDVIIKLIDNTYDGTYDVICATKYEYSVVDYVNSEASRIDIFNKALVLDLEDEDTCIILCDDNGNSLTLDEFDENDVVAVAYDGSSLRNSNYIKIVKLTGDVKKGTVEEKWTEANYSYVVIDGKEYADLYDTNFRIGEVYTFILGLTGKIVYTEVYDSDGDTPSQGGGSGGSSAVGGTTPRMSTMTMLSSGSMSGGSHSGTSLPSVTVPAQSEQYLQNAKMLISFGILTDVPNANDEITRADFANLLCRAMNLEEEAQNFKDKNKFNDIDADYYASGAINLLAEKGVIEALSGNNFCPDTSVRYAHAIKGAVDALGYSPAAKSMGAYPLEYVRYAKKLGALSGISCDYYLDCEMCVTLLNNILQIPLMKKITDGDDEYYVVCNGRGTEYETFLTDRKIYMATGVLSDFTEDTVIVSPKEDSQDGEFARGESYEFKTDSYTWFDLLYMFVDAYVKKTGENEYKLLMAVKNSIGTSLVINAEDICYAEDEYIEYYIDPRNSDQIQEIKFDGEIVYNMQVGKLNLEDLCGLGDAKVILIENNGDNWYDMAVVSTYVYGVVNSVNTQTHTITIDEETIEFYPESKNITNLFADGDGNRITLGDFEEGDFVAIMADNERPQRYNKFIFIQKMTDKKIKGVVDEIFTSNGNDYVVINEKEYKVGQYNDIIVGRVGIFYIGKTGNIELFEPDISGMNIAYILEAARTSYSFSADKWQVKLLKTTGEIVIYDVTEDMSYWFDQYFRENPQAFDCNEDACIFADATSDQKADPARVITYKLNSKGQIRAFAELDRNAESFELSEYNGAESVIAGTTVMDNTIVFDVSGCDAEDACVWDKTLLKDGKVYQGSVHTIINDKNKILVVSNYDREEEHIADLTKTQTSFAVATAVTKTMDSKNRKVTRVDYYCNGEEGYVYFIPTSLMHGETKYTEISVGSVFTFIADANGNVTDYDILARASVDNKLIPCDAIYDTEGTGTEFVYGYIANDKKNIGNKGELITINDGYEEIEICVPRTLTSKYTFTDTGEIVTGGFMQHEKMDYYSEENGYTSMVLVKLADGVVTDIYGYYDNENEGVAYILEAAAQTSSFSADKWQVKLLGANNEIAVYDVTEDTDYAFDRYFSSNTDAFRGDKLDGIFFDDATSAQKAHPARIIKFKKNAKGEIERFKNLCDLAKNLDGDEYKDSTNSIAGTVLADNTTVFDVSGYDAEDTCAWDNSILKDEGRYWGSVLEKTNTNKNDIMIITEQETGEDETEDIIITGVIDETYEKNGRNYAVISGKEYRVVANLDLKVGDAGEFYVGTAGVITDFEPYSNDVNTAYVLEATAQASSFSADKWQVKLLTLDGNIATYSVTDGADAYFDRYFSSNTDAFRGDKTDGILFDYATAAQKSHPARLIEFKTNSKGQIRSFAMLRGTPHIIEEGQYNDKTQRLDTAVLEEDIAIFNVLDYEADKASVCDLSVLYDEGIYSGLVLTDTSNENSIMILTNAQISFANCETSFAIATKLAYVLDEDGNECLKVEYYCNGEEGTVLFDDDSSMQGDIDFYEMELGSVFAFCADKNGIVTDYAVIATMAFGDFRLSQLGLDAVSDADTEFVHGYISNEKRITNAKGELIEIDHKDTFLVSNTTTNRYTFDDSGRNIVIRNGGFMEHPDMYYYDEYDGYTSKVLIKIVDGMVTDIYGFYNHKKN